jgi:hypothetical protein
MTKAAPAIGTSAALRCRWQQTGETAWQFNGAGRRAFHAPPVRSVTTDRSIPAAAVGYYQPLKFKTHFDPQPLNLDRTTKR